MIINPVSITENNNQIIIQSLIEYTGKQEVLWYSIDEKYKQYVTTEKLDGFLVGLLILAMKTGEDIYIKGAISEKLFYNLENYYMDIMLSVMPFLERVQIIPDSLDDGRDAKCDGAVATGFSGGVDSFCTIHDHFYQSSIPEHYKITDLVFNNVGSHGSWDSKKASKLFHERYHLTRAFPDDIGLNFIKIDSNLSDLLKISFQQTCVPRNISSILLLQKYFSKYFYASSYQYQDCFVGKADDLCYSDTFSVHLLSTETLDFISAGSQYTRVEKTRRMGLIDGAEKWINVCGSSNPKGGKNCSTCWKCKRTIFTLEMLGILDKFDQVFDLTRWKKIRSIYIITVVLGNESDPFIREIREYANTIGYNFTLSQKIVSRLINGVHFILPFRPMHLVRSIRRKITSRA